MSRPERKYHLSLTERQIRELIWWHDSDVLKWKEKGIKEPFLALHRYSTLRRYFEGMLSEIEQTKNLPVHVDIKRMRSREAGMM